MIGIFGGTFDPIHNGHVQVIENLLKIIHFDKLIVIPNGHPPHKDKGIDPKVKFELVNIALAHLDNIQIDERELNAETPSYAYLTYKQVQLENEGSSLAWVMGSDSFLGIETWYEYEKLLQEANLLILERPGYSLDDEFSVKHILEQRKVYNISDFHEDSGRIFISKIDPIELTSTKIRDSIRRNEDVSSLLNHDVHRLIKNKNLYKE